MKELAAVILELDSGAAGVSGLRTEKALRRTQGHAGGTEGAGSLELYVDGAGLW